MLSTLFWLPLIAASLHIFEEFAWPGGFAAWYRLYRPVVTRSANSRFLFWINVALLFVCFAVGVNGPTPYGSALFMTVAAVLFTNGFFHLIATVRMRRYSPGVVTGMLLYVPMTAYGYAVILQHGRASIGTAVTSAMLGGAYPLLSLSFHRWRAGLTG